MKRFCLSVAVMLFILPAISFAGEWEKYDKPVPTKLVIRVLSHGAKAMSPHTGAAIFIYDTATGKELDRGAVQGGTGDTTALMEVGYPREFAATGMLKGEKGMIFEDKKTGKPFDLRGEFRPEDLKPVVYESKDDAAKYEATIELTRPTLITVKAQGPLMPAQAMTVATQSFMMFPGQDITGEGIVLVLRGLIVDVLGSMREKEIEVKDPAERISIPFSMRMLCGCPIAPAGRFPWEAEGFNITTQAYYKGKLYHEETVSSDKIFKDVSSFAASVPVPGDLPEKAVKEVVKIRIMAAQPDMNNYGVDDLNVYFTRK